MQVLRSASPPVSSVAGEKCQSWKEAVVLYLDAMSSLQSQAGGLRLAWGLQLDEAREPPLMDGLADQNYDSLVQAAQLKAW